MTAPPAGRLRSPFADDLLLAALVAALLVVGRGVSLDDDFTISM
jgi:hypothetical protein